MIKRLLIAIVLLILIGGGLVGFNVFRDQAIENFFANMPAQTVTVSTVTAEPQSWTPTIDAIGTIAASRGVELTVEATGIVKEINFSANERTEAGKVLVQLDDAIQRADLAAARTQAELDQQSLERAVELQQRGVGSTVSLQAAEAAAAASAAQVEKLEAALQQKQIRAPFTGTLGIPRVDIGQYLTPGTTVVTLQDLDTMRADFTVPEQQLGLLEIGQKVTFDVDGIEGTFEGQIIGIDPRVDPASRLVSVRASLEAEGRLTPGQFTRVEVHLPVEEGVVALPQTAVVTSLYGDYVYVVVPRQTEGEAATEAGAAADGEGEPAAESEAAPEADQGEQATQEVRQRFVTVGRRSGQRVEITEGIEPGDVVVTAGQNRLSNGTLVTIDNTVNPAAEAAQESASR